jgi:hypothetical protein
MQNEKEYKRVIVKAYGEGWIPVDCSQCPYKTETACEGRSGDSYCGGFEGIEFMTPDEKYAVVYCGENSLPCSSK